MVYYIFKCPEFPKGCIIKDVRVETQRNFFGDLQDYLVADSLFGGSNVIYVPENGYMKISDKDNKIKSKHRSRVNDFITHAVANYDYPDWKMKEVIELYSSIPTLHKVIWKNKSTAANILTHVEVLQSL